MLAKKCTKHGIEQQLYTQCLFVSKDVVVDFSIIDSQ